MFFCISLYLIIYIEPCGLVVFIFGGNAAVRRSDVGYVFSSRWDAWGILKNEGVGERLDGRSPIPSLNCYSVC